MEEASERQQTKRLKETRLIFELLSNNWNTEVVLSVAISVQFLKANEVFLFYGGWAVRHCIVSFESCTHLIQSCSIYKVLYGVLTVGVWEMWLCLGLCCAECRASLQTSHTRFSCIMHVDDIAIFYSKMIFSNGLVINLNVTGFLLMYVFNEVCFILLFFSFFFAHDIPAHGQSTWI